MAHNYISESEKNRLKEIKKQKIDLDINIKEKNAALVGIPKEYKGIFYQMMQNGLYKCLNARSESKLYGSFTSPQVIKKLVDDIKKESKLTIKESENSIE